MTTVIPVAFEDGWHPLSARSENLFAQESDPSLREPLRYFQHFYYEVEVDWSRYVDARSGEVKQR